MTLLQSFITDNIIIVIAIILIFLYNLQLKDEFLMECKDLVAALNNNKIMLIDLRSHEDFVKEHIAGAINLTEAEAKQRISKQNKKQVVIVHKTNSQAKAFRAKIESLHPNVLVLNNGMQNWKQQQYPTVR